MHRVKLTVGGDKLTFDGPVSTPTFDLTTSKLHWNSVILTPGSTYLVVEFKKIYLNNLMAKHEYYNIAIILILKEVIDEYNLIYNQINSFLYVMVEKWMYWLVQAGIIAHTAIKKRLQQLGYEPAPITPGLWRHNKNGITFTIVVNDFGIKHQRKEDVLHLIHTIQEKYEITQDWTGGLYSGITLNWGCKAGILDISMPGYVKEALHKFQHPTPIQPQHSPHQCNPPNFGSTAPQLSQELPELPMLSPPESNTVQQVVETFLYYTRAVDPTMLVALNIIAAEQASST